MSTRHGKQLCKLELWYGKCEGNVRDIINRLRKKINSIWWCFSFVFVYCCLCTQSQINAKVNLFCLLPLHALSTQPIFLNIHIYTSQIKLLLFINHCAGFAKIFFFTGSKWWSMKTTIHTRVKLVYKRMWHEKDPNLEPFDHRWMIDLNV